MARHLIVSLVLAGLGSVPLELAAQPALPANAPSIGADLDYAVAVGDFADFVDHGWGGGLHLLIPLGSEGTLGVRADLGFLIYGRQRRLVDFPGTGGLIRLVLDTSNEILHGGLGPEISVPLGSGRLYGFGTLGFARFSTSSDLEGLDDDEEFARTENLADAVFAWTGGGGIRIPFHRSEHEWAFDLGAAYHGNGEVTYLTEERIQTGPGDQVILDPVRSQADFVTFRLGISVRIREGGEG